MIGVSSENIVCKNARSKSFIDADGNIVLYSVSVSSRPIFREDGWEPFDGSETVRVTDPDTEHKESDVADNIARSARRAQRACFDICICNDFEAFTTLTFSPEFVDRSSYAEVYHKLKTWLSNRVERRGLRYICVPELHKNKQGIHFHLLSNIAFDIVDSGHKRYGKPVYNVSDWKWGFSTCLMTTGEKSRVKVSKYIMKYMRKNFGAKVGGRFYLSGGSLARPIIELGNTADELLAAHGMSSDDSVFRASYDFDWGNYSEFSFI